MFYLFDRLESLSWVAGVCIVIVIFVLFAIVGILIVRKTIDQTILKKHHDVSGFVFANLGVLYAVLLGFTVVNAQQRFDKLKETIELEATYVADLYRDAYVFVKADSDAIRTSLKAYGQSVLNDEWDLMKQGTPSSYTIEKFNQVWHAYYAVNPSTPKQLTWYSESVNKLNKLASTRLARLFGSKESLGPEMWSLLIIGALVIVSFIWFFHIESLAQHIMMASFLAASTGFFLFLIYSLDTAFSGEVSISSTSLQNMLESLTQM